MRTPPEANRREPVARARDGGPSLANSVDLLVASLARNREQPWLFYRRPRGWGWGWVSWEQVADQVARAGKSLCELPVASAVAYDPWGLHGPSLDLALRAAGLLPVAVATTEALPTACTIRFEITSADPVANAGPTLPLARSRLEHWRGETPTRISARPFVGAAIVTGPGGRRRVSERDLILAAELLEATLPALPERPVVLAADPLGALHGRWIYTWALWRGAAQVLVTEVEDFVSAALEVRPHLVQGRFEDLALLASTFLGSRRLRRANRLLGVLLPKGEENAAGATDWERLGIPTLALDADTIPNTPWPGP